MDPFGFENLWNNHQEAFNDWFHWESKYLLEKQTHSGECGSKHNSLQQEDGQDHCIFEQQTSSSAQRCQVRSCFILLPNRVPGNICGQLVFNVVLITIISRLAVLRIFILYSGWEEKMMKNLPPCGPLLKTIFPTSQLQLLPSQITWFSALLVTLTVRIIKALKMTVNPAILSKPMWLSIKATDTSLPVIRKRRLWLSRLMKASEDLMVKPKVKLSLFHHVALISLEIQWMRQSSFMVSRKTRMLKF